MQQTSSARSKEKGTASRGLQPSLTRGLLLLTALAIVGCEQRSRPSEDSSRQARTSPEALVTIPVSTIGAAAGEWDFANIAPSRTLHVAKDGCNTSTGVCVDVTGCGLTRQTACLTVNQAIRGMGNGDEIRVYWHSTPYTDLVELYAGQAGNASGPRYITGVSNAQGHRPKFIPSLDDEGAYQSPFVFTTSYWVLDNVQVDCEDKPVTGVYPIGADHIAIRNSEIKRCRNSAIEVRGSQHVVVEGNLLHHNQKTAEDGLRADSNGVTISRGSKFVKVRANTTYDNSGDGFQCQGREQEDVNDVVYDPTNILIEENESHDDFENAVDIKSCNGVTIRRNRFYGYDAAEGNGGNCAGNTIILHYAARRVLIEENRISDTGAGIALGNEWLQTQDVVIRRNQIYRTNQDRIVTPKGYIKYNCGDGIRVDRVLRAEIYHNTIDQMPHSGIRVGADLYYRLGSPNCRPLDNGSPCQWGPADTVRVWNNIITNVAGLPYQGSMKYGGALDYHLENSPGLYSDANHFHASSGSAVLQLTQGLTGPDDEQMDLVAWKQQTAWDDSSGDADPLYEPSSDVYGYLLAGGSPAIDSALPDDGNAGSKQRCGAGPDKGALENGFECEPDAPSPQDPSMPQGPAPLWRVQRGTSFQDEYAAVAVDPRDGAVLATGLSYGGFGFTNSGGADAIISRYTAAGARDWIRQLGSSGSDIGQAVAVDAQGNVYIAGGTTGWLGTNVTGNLGGFDAFVAKYDPSGSKLWVRQFGTSTQDAFTALAIDGSGNVYATGSWNGADYTGTSPDEDIIIMALRPDGTPLLRADGSAVSYVYGTNEDDIPVGLAIRSGGADEGLYIAANRDGLVSTTPNIHLARLTLDLTPVPGGSSPFIWSRYDNIGTTVSAFTVDAWANLYVGGHKEGVGMLVKYNKSGTNVWTKFSRLGSMGEGFINGLAADAEGNVYVAGSNIPEPYYGSTSHAVTSKFSSLGVELWRRTEGPTNFATGIVDVAVDSSGHAVTVGRTNGAVSGLNQGGFDTLILRHPN